MGVITISRQFGSSSLEFGQALAKKLGYRYVDRGVIERASEELGMTRAEASTILDGHRGAVFTMVEKLSSVVLKGAGGSKYSYKIGEEKVDFLAQAENMILMLSEGGGLVLVGCGGQMILREVPRTAHIRLVADKEERIKIVMKREGCSKVSARDLMDRQEKLAKRFMQNHWGVDRDDPTLYDLVMNHTRLGHQAALALAEALLKAKCG